ncbi:MAG: hypothetical protein HKN19_02810 [Halioglobus sp.]|nr:hypothetical protein [Halioglobus sp.]
MECLVALLLFATGALGLLSSQLAGQRATHAALQRSGAVLLAQDLLARIEANPAARADYAVAELGVGTHEQPETDCRHSPCTPSELARFDLWQVAVALNTVVDDARVPRLARLPAARACIELTSEEVRVTLSWLDHAAAPGSAGSSCGADEALRRQVALSAWRVGVS